MKEWPHAQEIGVWNVLPQLGKQTQDLEQYNLLLPPWQEKEEFFHLSLLPIFLAQRKYMSGFPSAAS